jgi:hypothetical protein
MYPTLSPTNLSKSPNHISKSPTNMHNMQGINLNLSPMQQQQVNVNSPNNPYGIDSFHHLRRYTSPDVMFSGTVQRQEEFLNYMTQNNNNNTRNNFGKNGVIPQRPGKKPMHKDEELFLINLGKVTKGEDIRTTLMIKNIPNKYDQDSLLEAINDKYIKHYDFFYLPIDFYNKCNVGYAFINFINPLTIATFITDFNDKMWPRFNSVKVCKVTYARIQGKQNLIDHFRNSSLMFESPEFRPLIFKSEGPDAGEPEPFPFNQTRDVISCTSQRS